MLKQQTYDKLGALKLIPLRKALEEQYNNSAYSSMGFYERVGIAVDELFDDRECKKRERARKKANFKESACLEDISYDNKNGLDKHLVDNLATGQYIEKAQNISITGPTGVGKTSLACALGDQAVRQGYSVIYYRLSRLIEEFDIAVSDGTMPKLRKKLVKANLLILDDWALTPLSPQARQELLELIDDRSGNGSIIITSQLPVKDWHSYIGEATIADALLDRLVHRSHQVELRGESLRKIYGKKELEESGK